MIVLLVGGPYAGRAYRWEIPYLPPTLRFPIPNRFKDWGDLIVKSFDALGEATVDFEIAEYRRGDRVGTIVVGEICSYHFVGKDPYGQARTSELVVPFASPFGMAEIEDRAAVEALLQELGIKVRHG